MYALKHKSLFTSIFFCNFALQIYADDEMFRRLGGFETYFKSVYLRLILGC